MIFIVDPDETQRQLLAAAIGDAEPTTPLATLEEATDGLSRSAAATRMVVLGTHLDWSAALKFAEKVENERDGVATLLVTEVLDPADLRQALRSGVDDVLTLEATADEWSESIGRAWSRLASDRSAQVPAAVDEGTGLGRVVTVFSTKGGCGKSLVASNLAVMAAERGEHEVAMVDLNLQSGDLAIMLQLMPALSIYDAAQSADRLDAEALRAHLTPHRSNVALLASPLEPSLADQVTPDAVTRILALLRESYPLTVIDGPAMFTEQLLAALDLTDLIVLVGSMDVPSIKNLRLAMNTLSQLGHPREHLRIVLNRADSKVGLRVSEVEKSLGTGIDVQIPSDRDVPLSINQGAPLALERPRSPVVTAVGQLLPYLGSAYAEDRSARKRRRR